jgi:hypothetical protein
MVSDESTAGSIMTTEEDRKKYARQSHNWNLVNNPSFRLHFPDEAKKNHQSRVEELRKASEEKETERIITTVSNTVQVEAETAVAKPPHIPIKQGRSISRNILMVCLAVVGWAVATRLLSA